MNRKLVAQELVKIAKTLVAFEFDNKEQLQKYLKEHPKADKALHYVKKEEPKKSVKEKVKEKVKKHEHPEDLKKIDKRVQKLVKWLKRDALPVNIRDYFFANKGKEISEEELIENAKREHGKMLHPQIVKDVIDGMVKDEYMVKKGDKYVWNLSGEFTS